MPISSYWDLVEPYWDTISVHDGGDVFIKGYRAAPVAVRHLFTTHWCQSEACNGGFDQFFINSTGVIAPEAAAGFEALGLPQLAACVREALEFFGTSFPRERSDRLDLLIEYEEAHPEADSPFASLDKRFYALIHTENGGWESTADAFARRNAEHEN